MYCLVARVPLGSFLVLGSRARALYSEIKGTERHHHKSRLVRCLLRAASGTVIRDTIARVALVWSSDGPRGSFGMRKRL